MSASDRELNLSKREEKILEFWERNGIFEKTLDKTKRGKPFVFYEGPPTANAAPGIHHVEARSFKDVIPRYQTMRGRYVERKAGWDTHGLPVEIQVEKTLGFKTKREIEKFGIEKFNEKCRESVWRFKEEWEKLTKRIGFWLDLEHPYITYETSYTETLWWIIKEFWKKKLLYQDFKVVPWCPRCQTGLSTHELGQGYETVKDRSVYVRFRVKTKTKEWTNTSILSWTTTPWTLPGNVALAVNPKEDYVCVPDPEVKGHWLVLGEASFQQLLAKKFFPPEIATPPAGARNDSKALAMDCFKGREMLGIEYEPLFSAKELKSKTSHRVYAADFVSMEEGTGVVHTAVMYGEDDYKLGSKVGLPKFHTVTETGHFIKELGEGLGGLYVKDPKTEEKIIASLKRRGLLFKEELYEHEYPFCWRCDTPLLYYARQGWWVKVSAKRKELLANNEKINWVPEHLKHGRFGEFLKEARDWAFSRERYWGTPLPVWQCTKCKHQEVIGSLKNLDASDPAPTTIIFMRHGEVLHNVKNTVNPVSPENDRKDILTDKGRRQALTAARALKRFKIDAIAASPSFRSQETSRIVAKTLGLRNIRTLSDLNDIKMGGFEGAAIREFSRSFAKFEERFWKKPRGAENLRELRARMMKAIATIRLQYQGKRILVVSHGDPMWVLMAALEGMAESEYKKSPYLAPGEWREMRLHNWPYDAGGEVNLHRPYVDALQLRCGRCKGFMRRAPEVVDVWFDSGSMPFASQISDVRNQKSDRQEKKADVRNLISEIRYPADYICEAVDQTRGWFYTLLAVSTLLGRGPSYKNVVSLGHVLDKHGQKMSKSKGNIVDPWAMIEKYGTDTIRWYFYTVNAPGDPKRFDEKDLLLKLRGPIATFWNSFVFFNTYVDKIRNPKSEIRNPEGKPSASYGAGKPQIPNSKHVLDRWVMVRIDELTKGVSQRLEEYDIVGAARMLESFIVDDFSNWYLRRSRRRFQKPESRREKDEAASTTAYVLLRLAELMAPFTPFLAEIIYQELKKKLGFKEESVHLRLWPTVKPETRNPKSERLLTEMAEVRRLAALALAERAKAGIRVRQPLRELKIKNEKLKTINKNLIDLIRDEVNVKEIVNDPSIKNEVELDTHITAELREEGLIREFVRNIQEMRRDAGLKPRQGIMVQVIGNRVATAAIERWKKFVQKEAGVKKLQFGGKRSFQVEREIKLDGLKVWFGIRRM